MIAPKRNVKISDLWLIILVFLFGMTSIVLAKRSTSVYLEKKALQSKVSNQSLEQNNTTKNELEAETRTRETDFKTFQSCEIKTDSIYTHDKFYALTSFEPIEICQFGNESLLTKEVTRSRKDNYIITSREIPEERQATVFIIGTDSPKLSYINTEDIPDKENYFDNEYGKYVYYIYGPTEFDTEYWSPSGRFVIVRIASCEDCNTVPDYYVLNVTNTELIKLGKLFGDDFEWITNGIKWREAINKTNQNVSCGSSQASFIGGEYKTTPLK